MSRNPSESLRPHDKEGNPPKEKEPMTEEERTEKAMKDQMDKVHGATSGIANELRNAIDATSLDDAERKKLYVFVDKLYAYGKDASHL